MVTERSKEEIIASRGRFQAIANKQMEEEAERDEKLPNTETTIWKTIRGSIPNTNYRYTVTTHPIEVFEYDMHDLWHSFYQSAKVTPENDAGQDRLVQQILYARELGILSRTTSGEYEEAVTSDGKIWTDLPFLVGDFTGFWERSMELSPLHRVNFAAATARLVAVGIGGEGLSSCALWLFRETMETTRPFARAKESDVVPLSELLPACHSWFTHCGHKLVKLCAENHSPPNSSTAFSTLGELALKSGVEEDGFSIARWLFWRQRFKELTRCGDDTMRKEGKIGFANMIRLGREMGIKVPGEIEYQEKQSKFMLAGLKRQGTGCFTITPLDMPINSDSEWESS